MQATVYDFLATVAKGSDGPVMMDSNTVALQTGVSRETVNKVLFNLNHHGKIELVRGTNGRSIVGFRLLVEPKARRQRQAPPATLRERLEEPVKVTGRVPKSSILTPALDQYQAAKEKFNSISEQFGELVEASFKTNDYAEEGLRLRERLRAIEPDLVETRRELEEANRDLRALRGKHRSNIAAKVAESGTMVEHGD